MPSTLFKWDDISLREHLRRIVSTFELIPTSPTKLQDILAELCTDLTVVNLILAGVYLEVQMPQLSYKELDKLATLQLLVRTHVYKLGQNVCLALSVQQLKKLERDKLEQPRTIY